MKLLSKRTDTTFDVYTPRHTWSDEQFVSDEGASGSFKGLADYVDGLLVTVGRELVLEERGTRRWLDLDAALNL